MIITMLPSLAALIHTADSTLHDNTYKRVYGKWKEWEVVIWDKQLNMSKFILFTTGPHIWIFALGVTVARIYCTHETRAAFL